MVIIIIAYYYSADGKKTNISYNAFNTNVEAEPYVEAYLSRAPLSGLGSRGK